MQLKDRNKSRTNFSKILNKQKYFQVQTKSYYDKEHGFIWYMENIILAEIVQNADGKSLV